MAPALALDAQLKNQNRLAQTGAARRLLTDRCSLTFVDGPLDMSSEKAEHPLLAQHVDVVSLSDIGESRRVSLSGIGESCL